MADRVMLVTESSRPGGLATQAGALAASLAEQGFDPLRCTLDGPAASGCPAGCGRRMPADPLALMRVRQRVRREAPAVVHAWGETAAAYASFVVGPAKLVVTLGRAGHAAPGWRQAVGRGWRRRADRIVATSPAVASRLGVESVVILPGVPMAAAPQPVERRAVRGELGLPAGARVILIVARLLTRKRVKELLWCADLMRVLRDETRVLVAGTGPQAPALVRFARLASDLEHIRFLGEQTDVPRLLRAAEVFWQAGDEASPPLAMLEAMAAGVPVVADETPGAQLAITNHQTGRLIPIGGRAERARATERLFTTVDEADAMASAARRSIATRFAVDRMTVEYAALYQSLLARHG